MAYVSIKQSSMQLVIREMQSKTTVRYHYKTTKLAKIKKTDHGNFC